MNGEPTRRLTSARREWALPKLVGARRGRPIVLDGFDLLSALSELNQYEVTMKEKSLPFSVAPNLYRSEDVPASAFAYHLTQIIEIADGDREEITLQTKRGEIALKREEVQPGFYVAAVFTS